MAEFVELLDAFEGDSWYDYAADEAAQLLAELCESEWDALDAMWPSKTPPWQEKLAYILDHAPLMRALPILEMMSACSEHHEVLSTAREVLIIVRASLRRTHSDEE